MKREEIDALVSEAVSAEFAKYKHPESPSPENLALIAALVARGEAKRPARAVAEALELYYEACTVIDWKTRLQAAYAREAEAETSVPQPAKFPAPLEDFLRLIVKAKTPADGTKRFRDFLRDRCKRFCVNVSTDERQKIGQQRLENQVAEQLKEYQRRSFPNRQTWYLLTKEYLIWWAEQKRKKAQAAARKRKKGS